jgi:transcriptional regulator with XRE-family HTH domain
VKQVENFEDLLKIAKSDGSFDIESTKLRFAICLNKLMKAEGHTRSDLAKKIGKSNAYITKALRGDTNFTISSMVTLARALGGKIDVVINDSRGLEVSSAAQTVIEVTKLSNMPSGENWKIARTEDRNENAQRLKLRLISSTPRNIASFSTSNTHTTAQQDDKNGQTLLAA